MARQSINTGAGGDSVKQGFDDCEANFIELYSLAIPVQAVGPTGNYTLQLSDAGKVIEMNSASPNTLTVPPNSSVAFPIGTVLEVYQQSSGTTTIAAGAGVTVRNAGNLRAQYSTAGLRKRATDTWVVSGDMA